MKTEEKMKIKSKDLGITIAEVNSLFPVGDAVGRLISISWMIRNGKRRDWLISINGGMLVMVHRLQGKFGLVGWM